MTDWLLQVFWELVTLQMPWADHTVMQIMMAVRADFSTD